MTPAINFLTQQQIPFTQHMISIPDPTGHYGLDAANAMSVAPDRVFKTLVVSLDGQPRQLAVCILPVSHELNLKLAAKAHGAKKAQMAEPALAEKITGYVVGGISPFGMKRTLPCVLDEQALHHGSIYTSGGRRNLEIEFSPVDVIRVLNVKTAPLCR